ncbi:hypothetical protein CJ195_19020 [Bacillus sp. UMB0899]|nr:hypothetical protein CJ195_19020 [Bacillus sp. UMB0899]
MLINITQTFDKQRRQLLSDRSYTVELLKTLIYTNNFEPGHIKLKMQHKLQDQVIEKGSVFKMVDNSFKSCLLYEANLQFNKALYNWSSYKRLVTKGLWSWAYVTLYYAQFYAVTGLLNIQGNAFTRPIFQDKEHQLHIYPEDFERGIFIIESRRLNKPHEDVWRQFYNVYKKFRFKLTEYHELYQYDQENQFNAIQKRNFTNYDILYDFPEYNFNEDELLSFRENMSRDIFQVQDKDEFLNEEFIASLRIKLLFEQLDEILSSDNFGEIKSEFNEKRKTMLHLTSDDTPVKNAFHEWIVN